MARARRLSQRSAEWHALRQFRVTASSFAAAVGTDELRSVESALWEMVDPGARSPGPRGRAAMTYGQLLEQHVFDVYAARRPHVKLAHVGLCIAPEMPWLACSPDALVRDGEEVGLLEVKCPTVRSDLQPLEYRPYLAQIQGIMGILRLPWCDFAVWTRKGGLSVQRVSFDPAYFDGLVKKLNSFYFERFVPFAVRLRTRLNDIE